MGEAKGETKLQILDEPSPDGARWQRWNLETDLARERRLGEISLPLKVPKNCTLHCYVVPTLLLTYPDVIAMVEDIEAELGVEAACRHGAWLNMARWPQPDYVLESSISRIEYADH